MKTYTTLLMDADDTIFDFPQCEFNALRATLENFGLPFNQTAYDRFTHINAALWKLFEKNQITRSELRLKRFSELIEQCFAGYDHAEALADEYVRCLAEQAIFLPEAPEALRRLSAVYDIYIITNGLKTVQRKRFEQSGLYAYIKDCFISDEMGVQKPMKAYFDRVFENLAEKDLGKILVVGDSLTSDMQGGKNAGLDTCLYDPHHKVTLPHPLCTYRIDRLLQLLNLSAKQKGVEENGRISG